MTTLVKHSYKKVNQQNMHELLNKYRNQAPTIVFEWHDTETNAEGWVVINSLRGGAAGGGTRMRKGLNRAEVEALAKIMEIKFSVSGPSIGGAKSGINFDPRDPRRDEVLYRWFQAVTPLLKHYYGTGGDLNVDEIKQVIPITEDFGLWHPQEGVVNGHFQPKLNQKIHLLGQLRQGVSKVVENPLFAPEGRRFMIADLITGYGVAESVRHYYDIYHQSKLTDKKVIIQGWGNVAATAGWYLALEGAKIVGIIDRFHGIIKPEGLTETEVKELFVNRDGNRLSPDSPNVMTHEEVNAQIWDVEADIFIPGAASKLVDRSQVERLLSNGLNCISSGANDPFKDNDLFFGDTAKYVDDTCSLIPDFIANCGMARVFAYLMQKDVELSDEAVFNDVSFTIREALFEVYKHNTGKQKISQTALGIALKKLLK